MQYYVLPSAAAHTLTVGGTAGTLESFIDTAHGSATSLPTTLNAAEISAEGGNIRYLLDGNTPTASIGMPLNNGETRLIRGEQIGKIRLISQAGSVTVQCQVGITDQK